jgi:large subunit ribosomal protein L33
MAKTSTIKIRLNSSADTGYFYVTKKPSKSTNKKMTEKIKVRKYDPKVRKHVEFTEGKIK